MALLAQPCLFSLPARAEEDSERQRLTEREDKRRPAEPLSIDLAGRPLVLSGAVEAEVSALRQRFASDTSRRNDRTLPRQALEAEAFYSFAAPISAFAQARAVSEKQPTPNGRIASSRFVERGEMWLYGKSTAQSRFSFDAGRLHFEDDRRWWWDEELDAVRLAFEAPGLEIAVALAREIGSNRSDRSFVEPQHDRVHRLIAEASWDWNPHHAAQLFLLRQDDRSATEIAGQLVLTERKDESDAKLTWLGARLIGAFDLNAAGKLGYWLDTARVHGDETRIQFNELPSLMSVAQTRAQRQVSGWALDTGLNWTLPGTAEPRVFAGLAYGSGGVATDGGADRSFRQTGIHANESGFGGARRFARYGRLLDPELSNLSIMTLGTGLSLLQSSSVDLVVHRYRQVRATTALSHARLDAALTGTHRAIGNGVDLVLALEEWQRIEVEIIASGFRTGSAFGENEGRWSTQFFVAMRIAF